MQQLETVNNPFSIIHYNCSWAAIKEQITEIMQRFPSRYKMAYHEEDEQKIILFTSLDFTVFGREHMMVIYISKIDSGINNSMLAYEAKKLCRRYNYKRRSKPWSIFYRLTHRRYDACLLK